MARAKTTTAAIATATARDGEVRVEKVDRLGSVYNAVTKPSVYANPMPTTMVVKRPPAAAAGYNISREKIDDYIARKKKQFAQEA